MLAEACSAAVRVLASGGSSTDAAVAATVVLEVNGFLNCGKQLHNMLRFCAVRQKNPFQSRTVLSQTLDWARISRKKGRSSAMPA